MKIISVHCGADTLQGSAIGTKLMGGIGRDSLLLRLETADTEAVDFTVRLVGAVLTPLDAERSVGKAAAGAIAGGLLLGPLGLVAGGVMAAGRKHTLVLKSPDARVVFEASTKEFQELAGLGMPSAGDVPLQRAGLPKGKKKSHFLGYVALLVVVGMMAKCAMGKGDAHSSDTASSGDAPHAGPLPQLASAPTKPLENAAAQPKATARRAPSKPQKAALKSIKVAADPE